LHSPFGTGAWGDFHIKVRVRLERALLDFGAGAAAVEHGHFPVSYHHKLLFFEWMEPRHEGVDLDTRGESQMGGCHFGYFLVHIVAACGQYLSTSLGRRTESSLAWTMAPMFTQGASRSPVYWVRI